MGEGGLRAKGFETQVRADRRLGRVERDAAGYREAWVGVCMQAACIQAVAVRAYLGTSKSPCFYGLDPPTKIPQAPRFPPSPPRPQGPTLWDFPKTLRAHTTYLITRIRARDRLVAWLLCCFALIDFCLHRCPHHTCPIPFKEEDKRAIKLKVALAHARCAGGPATHPRALSSKEARPPKLLAPREATSGWGLELASLYFCQDACIAPPHTSQCQRQPLHR